VGDTVNYELLDLVFYDLVVEVVVVLLFIHGGETDGKMGRIVCQENALDWGGWGWRGTHHSSQTAYILLLSGRVVNIQSENSVEKVHGEWSIVVHDLLERGHVVVRTGSGC
jgi:hypothetical protein